MSRQWARPAPPATPSTLRAATDATDSPATVDAAAIKEVGVRLAVSGALLGPCLDNYHSAFGVLKYNAAAVPLTLTVGGNELLHTAAFVPPLFGFAAVLIGGLYVLLDVILDTPAAARSPSPPVVLCGISFFTGQYWLSGLLAGPYAAAGLPLAATHAVLLVTGLLSWQLFDRTRTGFAVGLMTAVGGTVIEMGLINFLGLYNYLAADLLGVDSWIPWVVSERSDGGVAHSDATAPATRFSLLSPRPTTRTHHPDPCPPVFRRSAGRGELGALLSCDGDGDGEGRVIRVKMMVTAAKAGRR